MGLEIGQLVSSEAGQVGGVNLVVELLDDNFVLVTDGKTREDFQAKRKRSIKHLVAHQ